MQLSSLPTKFPVPFANAAGAGFIRPIPQASQIGIVDGAASLTDGFPPLNFQPVAAGGVPPFGQDHNGLLNQITAWVRALTAGMMVPYDATFQTAIGGYPRKAWVFDTATGAIWESAIDNNTSSLGSSPNWTAASFADVGSAGLIVSGTGANGAGLKLAGNGATPNKWVRASAGQFQVLNNAYTGAILDIDDAGNGVMPGNIFAGSRLRAAIGARGSGDPNAATLLNDFVLSGSGSGYQILPNGFIIQWGQNGATGHLDVINFPIAFPNICLAMAGSENGVTGWDSGGTPGRTSVYGFQVVNAAQFYMSCVQIDIYAGPLQIHYIGDFGKWIAVGF